MAAVSVLHKGGGASHELYLLRRRRTIRVPELGMCSEPLPWSLAYRSRTIQRRAANGMSLARRFETRRVELDYTRGKQLRWAMRDDDVSQFYSNLPGGSDERCRLRAQRLARRVCPAASTLRSVV
ncbi:hypothetical protein K466DRAFT_607141 [Polyporus arcularius HHB13444]|uniref:Uncharacterized protein n=1 Tax=Polyporus arcularius HHB13444 TaxID=1314778 RepID=A0A5C3NXP8_9APHY|nr:hypothetical protein K466DRAFT_607141 [Polyporus arcularius HHB13444]